MLDRVVEAVVQAGSHETSYRRAGTGRPVVLLLRAAVPTRADPLFDALAREFRVVAPALPDAPLLLDWVRAVIDGLGLERPALLVDASLAGSLAGVAFSDDDRCGCFVVLHPAQPSADGPWMNGDAEHTQLGGHPLPVAYRSRVGGVRLLELPLDDDGVGLSATSLAALSEFLRTDCYASGD
jgi:hypothetical protein